MVYLCSLLTLKPYKESSKLSVMIHTNLDLTGTNNVLLSCIKFTTLLQVVVIRNYGTL